MTTPGGGISLRLEAPGDEDVIRDLTRRAFATTSHSDGSEPAIVDALRRDGDLALSLVAADESAILAHVAFSPVRIDGEHDGWYGLGPLSVEPDHQRLGIGSRLVRDGLDRLTGTGAKGCALVGDPAFYGRFGFAGDGCLSYPGIEDRYVQHLVLVPPGRCGTLAYARAFAA